jgi:hypothetical protein
MQRRWQVQPNGTGVLSREQLIEALIDGAAILDIAGAVLEWKDRTDAKPQPEPAATVTEPAAEPEPEAIPGQLTVDDALEPDGFDYSKLEAEDVEEPTPAR